MPNDLQNASIETQQSLPSVPLSSLFKRPRFAGGSARLFKLADLSSAQSTADLEGSAKYEAYLGSLITKGEMRKLVLVTDTAIDAVSKLKQSFPNFIPVIDFILEHMTVCAMSRPSFFRMPPIALGGVPGLGKTHFCKALAKCIGIPTEFVSCSGSNAEFTISGLERGFTTGHPGRVAEYYRHHTAANPLFVMDEFEKPSTTGRSNNTTGSFFGPFYTLLEPSTAIEFKDNYLDLNFDASFINWIMTVNEFDRLPEPIRSRLTYFEINEPTPRERIAIAQSIYGELVRRYSEEREITFDPDLSDDLAQLIAKSNPRDMRKGLDQAMVRAVMSRYQQNLQLSFLETVRYHLEPSHLSVVTEESPPKAGGIGFMAQL